METLTAIAVPTLSALMPASSSALVARYLGEAGELLRELEVCAGPRRLSRDHVLPIFREAMRCPLPRSIVLSRQVPPARSIRLDEALALCHLAAAAARIEITPVALRHEGALGIAELSVEVFRGTAPRAFPPGWLVVERQVEGRLQVAGSDLRQLFRLALVAKEMRLEGVCWRVVGRGGSVEMRLGTKPPAATGVSPQEGISRPTAASRVRDLCDDGDTAPGSPSRGGFAIAD